MKNFRIQTIWSFCNDATLRASKKRPANNGLSAPEFLQLIFFAFFLTTAATATTPITAQTAFTKLDG